MIDFKKRRSTRVNPFKGLEDDETKLEIGDIIDDATPIRNKRCRYDPFENDTCIDSLNEKTISSDEKEFDKLSNPIKREVSSDSDQSMDDSDYSQVPTKPPRFSKDEDDEIEVSPNEDKDSSNIRSSSFERRYSQDVKNINKNNPISGEKKIFWR